MLGHCLAGQDCPSGRGPGSNGEIGRISLTSAHAGAYLSGRGSALGGEMQRGCIEPRLGTKR